MKLVMCCTLQKKKDACCDEVMRPRGGQRQLNDIEDQFRSFEGSVEQSHGMVATYITFQNSPC